ncbi:hypothetical protein JTB14_037724 [Gonioctena quinquepunctata]|nr:hypothetical protein JTB14_037724 [Gonioctena quinquepunctata]
MEVVGATEPIILDENEGIFCKKGNFLDHAQSENIDDQLAIETPSTSSGEPEESEASNSREPDRSESRTPMSFDELLLRKVERRKTNNPTKQGSRLQNRQR